MGTLTCLQLANSKIYRENFPPAHNFAKIMILPDAFLTPLMEPDPFWPFKVCHFDLPGLRYEPETTEKYQKVDGRSAILPAVQSKKVANIKVAPPQKSLFSGLMMAKKSLAF
jgi:hypothetical protein